MVRGEPHDDALAYATVYVPMTNVLHRTARTVAKPLHYLVLGCLYGLPPAVKAQLEFEVFRHTLEESEHECLPVQISWLLKSFQNRTTARFKSPFHQFVVDGNGIVPVNHPRC